MEFLAGTLPDNPRSHLEFDLVVRSTTGELRFELFPGRFDRRYRIQQSSSLDPAHWQPLDGTWNDLGAMRWTLGTSRQPDPHRFYRLLVERR